MLLLGYNSNGFPHHRWQDGIALAAEVGYRSIAITVDHHWLDPYGPQLEDELAATGRELERLGLRSVIETGARFLLDPRTKHEPTLMTADPEGRARRTDFLKRCIDIAVAIGADAVSFWAGVAREPLDRSTGLARLTEGVGEVLDYANQRSVPLAFEPEPGMFVERVEQYFDLVDAIERSGHNARRLGLTLDIGHLQCSEAEPPASYVQSCGDRLFNVHIEDMCRGVHEHLRFGDGEIDFPPVLRALEEVGYANGVHVELSRHGHMAPLVMRESFEFLSQLASNPNVTSQLHERE